MRRRPFRQTKKGRNKAEKVKEGQKRLRERKKMMMKRRSEADRIRNVEEIQTEKKEELRDGKKNIC